MNTHASPLTANQAVTQSGSAPAVIELAAHDLPAFCPNPSMPVWNHHPRVFLDVTQGEAQCAYCGTTYRLKAGEKVHGH